MNLFLFFFAELFFHQADALGQCFFDGLARGDDFCVVAPGHRCISDGKSLLFKYSPNLGEFFSRLGIEQIELHDTNIYGFFGLVHGLQLEFYSFGMRLTTLRLLSSTILAYIW